MTVQLEYFIIKQALTQIILWVSGRAGQYTTVKSKRKYSCHTGIDIKQKILYQQTDVP